MTTRHFMDEEGYVVSASEHYWNDYLDDENYHEVTVIDSVLPQVNVTNDEDAVRVGSTGTWNRAFVLENFLAIAAAHAWFTEHPAVDEAQVKALVADMQVDILTTADLARHLVAQGWANSKVES